MTRKTKLFLFTGLLTILFVGVVFYLDSKFITALDRPFFLSSKEETIEVTYVSFLCDCANFIETKNYKTNPVTEPGTSNFIFIESASPDLKLDSSFYYTGRNQYNLKLTGSFYFDKGIPETYTYTDPFKPELARVFRYNKIEFVSRKNGE